MFFDATAKHDDSVVDAVEKLFSCCVPPDKTRTSKKPMPPLVVFKWGNVTSFPAFVTQVNAKYTLFAPNGVPIRAVCTVNLEEMPGEKSKQNPTSGVFDVDRAHTMIAGDTLALGRLPRVRRPHHVACAGRVQRHRRPDAHRRGHGDPAAADRNPGEVSRP